MGPLFIAIFLAMLAFFRLIWKTSGWVLDKLEEWAEQRR